MAGPRQELLASYADWQRRYDEAQQLLGTRDEPPRRVYERLEDERESLTDEAFLLLQREQAVGLDEVMLADGDVPQPV